MLRYAVILPVRDEEKHIARMLDAVLAQKRQPVSVHAVDDGSCDRTPEILRAYAQKCKKIIVSTLPRRGVRGAGGESAIHAAFRSVDWEVTDVLARLDADISFEPNFFEILMGKFEEDAKLGIASGVIYEQSNGRWEAQPCPAYHTRGASKLYRRECYQRIKPIGTWIEEQDVIAAFFSDVPSPFYSMMVRLLEQAGFDYKKYGYPKNNNQSK